MKFGDTLKMTGTLEILVKDLQGRVIRTINVGKNIITLGGQSDMAHLLAGDEVSTRKVFELSCGDGGHDTGSPSTPLPVDETDTDLYGTLIITKQVSYDFPDGVSGVRVRFTADILPSEGNGTGSQEYSEIGLYDSTGRMINHKTFGLITKTSAFGLSFRVTITFGS